MSFAWRCPFCQHHSTILNSNCFVTQERTDKAGKYGPLVFRVEMIVCPNSRCQEFTLTASLWDAEHPTYQQTFSEYHNHGSEQYESWRLRPLSRARPFPAYIPRQVIADYNEACAIENLSPKASATLSRRCLQGIIRSFFGVTKPRLIEEIKAIEERVDPKVYAAIDALRELGNLGAHPEKDVDAIIDVEPDEAAALIELIELLIEETYIADHERQARLDKITTIAADKAAIRANAQVALPK